MKLVNKYLVACFLCLAGFQLQAQENLQSDKTPEEKLIELQKHTTILPTGNMYFAENENGVFVFSENGRFVFQGKVYDSWQKKNLDTLSDAKKSHYVPLADLGVPPETLAALHTKSKGEVDLVIFTDPACTSCNAIYEQVDDELSDYRVAYVLTNLVGNDKSSDKIKRLWCEKDKSKSLKMLMDSEEVSIPDISYGDCNLSRLFKNLTVARMLGVDRVPFLMRRDGKIFKGRPKSLKSFMETEQ